MSLIWKDELATVLIGIAAVLYLLWAGGTPVLGLSGPCRSARSGFQTNKRIEQTRKLQSSRRG